MAIEPGKPASYHLRKWLVDNTTDQDKRDAAKEANVSYSTLRDLIYGDEKPYSTNNITEVNIKSLWALQKKASHNIYIKSLELPEQERLGKTFAKQIATALNNIFKHAAL